MKQLSNINKVEYALFIRPDLFDFEVVKRVKEISNKIVAYQWDGMERFPLIKKYIDLFDKFYVFDSNDVKISPKLEPTTNFYFDDILVKKDIEPRTVFFVGTYALVNCTQKASQGSITFVCLTCSTLVLLMRTS